METPLARIRTMQDQEQLFAVERITKSISWLGAVKVSRSVTDDLMARPWRSRGTKSPSDQSSQTYIGLTPWPQHMVEFGIAKSRGGIK